MMIYQNLSVSVTTGFLIVAFGTYTIRRYMKPFEELTQAFSSIREGHYIEMIPSQHAAEFKEIIQAYNHTVKELEAVHNKLRVDANVDGLTGALNRRAFVQAKESIDLEMHSRSLNTLGVILIDFDDFKNVNDSQGHLAGDDVLKEFVELAKAILAPHPLFRYGGDEFIAVLRNVPRVTVVNIAEQIRLCCENKLRGSTTSIGVATYPENAKAMNELLALADETLYTSKATKNKVTEYPAGPGPEDV
jgi:diguanylate cyclase (GGDEF)-like protein